MGNLKPSLYARAVCAAALCLLTVGCGDSGKLKNIVIQQPAFAAPIVLHLNADGSAANDILFGLGGVDRRPYTSLTWSGGPDRFNGNRQGCYWNTNGSAPGPESLALSAQINAYPQGFTNPYSLFNWLVNHGAVNVYVWPVKYTNVAYTSPAGNAINWYCSVVDEKFASAHAAPGTSNYHDGFDLVVATRRVIEWTYTNSYEADVPGKGKVKFFAGTFTYTADASVPDVTFASDGNATVKMFLDPDTGKWVVDTFQLHEPGVTLQNSGTPENPYAVDPRLQLFTAIEQSDWNKLRKLLDAGINPNAIRPGYGSTVLIAAVTKSNGGDKGAADAIKMLLDHGALVNAKATWGGTALSIATANPQAAKLLLDHGADVDARSASGETPLFGAFPDMAAILIAHGADVNAKSNTGDTPLHAAARAGLLAKVQMLVAKGANVNATNNQGQTPIEVVSQYADKAITPFLKAHGAKADTPSYLPALVEQMKSPAYRRAMITMAKIQPVNPWLASYINRQANSVEGPGHLIAVGNAKYEIYSTCEAHNCGFNMYYVLVAPKTAQAWALHQTDMNVNRAEFYGNPDNEKRAVLLQAMQRVINGQGF